MGIPNWASAVAGGRLTVIYTEQEANHSMKGITVDAERLATCRE
jgi:hypothetical protein